MNCIKCGRKISDGELFCIECSLMPSKAPTPPAPPKTASKSVNKASADKNAKPAARDKAQPAKGQKPTTQPQRTASRHAEPEPVRPRRRVGLVISLVLTLLIAAAMAAFILLNWGKLLEQKANLRVREADITLRESDMVNLEKQLSETTNKLTAANQQVDDLTDQIDQLKKQLSGTQSAVSQTQYDITSQQQQMQQLVDENTELSTLVTQLEQQSDDLTKQLKEASATSAAYGAKADFMDAYVVFVNNDGSKSYHKYDCEDFKRQSFWAYSRKLAEGSGFTACPKCFPG